MPQPTVLFACGDPGGAAAIAPVIERFACEKKVAVRAYAYHQSPQILERRGFESLPIPVEASPVWFDAAIRENDAACVVVATSHNGRDHEKRFVAAARRGGVPSVAILDFWSNYRVRFADAAGHLVYAPDWIAVMDDAAREGLVEAGLRPDSILITGHPGFDALPEQRAAFSRIEREAMRRDLGVAPDEYFILFASQPLRELYGSGPEAAAWLGYDQHSVLEMLLVALGRLEHRVCLIVRPHPRDSEGAFQPKTSSRVRLDVSASGNARSVAMAADLVVGMNSMLLVEAAYLGCKVLSVQPNSRSANHLPGSVGSVIPVVFDGDCLAGILDELIGQPARLGARVPTLPAIGAAATITSFVYDIIARSHPV